MTTARKVGIGTAAAGVIAATVAFVPNWEGMDKVAKRDMIGTGHPVTYCYGQTDEFGTVKVGTRFNKQQCDEKLAESLPKYLERLDKCIKVPLPTRSVAALLDASYNAGTGAVCKSPMLAKMNAGDIRGGCNAFVGWYVRSDGQVRKGLIARRSGIGDGRKSERDLCLEGLNEPKNTWYAPVPTAAVVKQAAASKPYVCTSRQAEAGECLPLVPSKPAAKPSCDFPWLSAACYGGRA